MSDSPNDYIANQLLERTCYKTCKWILLSIVFKWHDKFQFLNEFVIYNDSNGHTYPTISLKVCCLLLVVSYLTSTSSCEV